MPRQQQDFDNSQGEHKHAVAVAAVPAAVGVLQRCIADYTDTLPAVVAAVKALVAVVGSATYYLVRKRDLEFVLAVVLVEGRFAGGGLMVFVGLFALRLGVFGGRVGLVRLLDLRYWAVVAAGLRVAWVVVVDAVVAAALKGEVAAAALADVVVGIGALRMHEVVRIARVLEQVRDGLILLERRVRQRRWRRDLRNLYSC